MLQGPFPSLISILLVNLRIYSGLFCLLLVFFFSSWHYFPEVLSHGEPLLAGVTGLSKLRLRKI